MADRVLSKFNDGNAKIQSYIRKAHYEVIGIRFLGSLYNLLLCYIKSAKSDVLNNTGGKEDRLLTHHSDHISQVADVNRTDVMFVYKHLNNHRDTTVHFK